MSSITGWVLGKFGGGGGTFFRRKGKQIAETARHKTKSSTVAVTQDSALTQSAVYRACDIISGTISSLPLGVFDEAADGTKTPNKKHEVAQLFSGKVNRYQTRVDFFLTIVMQDVLHGNAYALKQRNSEKKIIGLLPLMTSQIEVNLSKEDGAVTYKYNVDVGSRIFQEDDIVHFKGAGNGIIGNSRLSFAQKSVGTAIAADERMNQLYSNGGKPAGVLMTSNKLNDDQRKAVKQNFKDMAEGSDDTLFVLEHGFQYQQIAMTPKDIELLESRAFQVKDIARFFGVPSVMLDDSSATNWGSGVAELIEGFYKFTIRPYLERYEATLIASLLKPEERDNIVIEFDFNALLRGDKAKRYRTYKEGITGAFLTPNEARSEEGKPPLPGGNSLYMQQQMVPIEKLGTVKRGANEGRVKKE